MSNIYKPIVSAINQYVQSTNEIASEMRNFNAHIEKMIKDMMSQYNSNLEILRDNSNNLRNTLNRLIPAND